MYYLYFKVINKMEFKTSLPKIKKIFADLFWTLFWSKTALSTKSLIVLQDIEQNIRIINKPTLHHT